ncbi:hypothetical protein L1085_000475 [Streptomyces sp. MSC1_001]|jgi:hypothetical protein|uniref:hypothetical protein n=1 Tax=Streptomyces sp. MSC1_001 TaxID=2909263 RepID=UPI00202F1579|nr:hypothetical protein [Streptomyces sp. MSC1_001]
MVGRIVRTAAADIEPQSMLKLEMNPFRAVGTVLLSSLFISVTERKSSFQQRWLDATRPPVTEDTVDAPRRC